MSNNLSPYGPSPPLNGTTADNSKSSQNVAATIAIASVLPILIAIFLLVMILMALVLPRLSRVEVTALKEERKKKRMEHLNSSLSSQKFHDWRTKEIATHPDTVISAEPLCVICLETIQDKALVRGLSCHHVYHQQCLDNWYGRFHEYCPLCHRLILPTRIKAGDHTDSHATESVSTQAIAFMA